MDVFTDDERPFNPCGVFGMSVEHGASLIGAYRFLTKFIKFAAILSFMIMMEYTLIETPTDYVELFVFTGNEPETEYWVLESGLNLLASCILLLAIYYESEDLVCIGLSIELFKLEDCFLFPAATVELNLYRYFGTILFKLYQIWVLWSFKNQLAILQWRRQVVNVINDLRNNNPPDTAAVIREDGDNNPNQPPNGGDGAGGGLLGLFDGGVFEAFGTVTLANVGAGEGEHEPADVETDDDDDQGMDEEEELVAALLDGEVQFDAQDHRLDEEGLDGVVPIWLIVLCSVIAVSRIYLIFLNQIRQYDFTQQEFYDRSRGP